MGVPAAVGGLIVLGGGGIRGGGCAHSSKCVYSCVHNYGDVGIRGGWCRLLVTVNIFVTAGVLVAVIGVGVLVAAYTKSGISRWWVTVVRVTVNQSQAYGFHGASLTGRGALANSAG